MSHAISHCGEELIYLPPKLANKHAIINVRTKDKDKDKGKDEDNECLKCALRAALFPPEGGEDPQRPSKYPKNDGINYKGIDFPTPVGQIIKLKAQNRTLQ